MTGETVSAATIMTAPAEAIVAVPAEPGGIQTGRGSRAMIFLLR